MKKFLLGVFIALATLVTSCGSKDNHLLKNLLKL